MRTKLAGWKTKALSAGDRAIAYQARPDVNSLTYHGCFGAPNKYFMTNGIHFCYLLLWLGGGEGEEALEGMEELCKPVEKDGLGFMALDAVLQAFSCKLWWWLRTTSTLWTRFMSVKYGQ